MSAGGPRSLADLLHTGDLGKLRAEAERRRTLTEEVRARLPAGIGLHLTAAHREGDGRLVLSADSAAWAARIRFIADDAGLGTVTVRVAPRAGIEAPQRSSGKSGQSGTPGAS
jgi:hypothetical protein